MINRKASRITRIKIYQKNEAERIAKRILWEPIKLDDITAFEEGENIEKLEFLPIHLVYSLEILPRSMAVYIGVSKQGGHVVWMRNPRPV